MSTPQLALAAFALCYIVSYNLHPIRAMFVRKQEGPK